METISDTIEGKSGKSDRRVRRTKTLLENALLTFLRDRPLKDVTVKELCEAADVNRSTFYLHYKDVYDMMDQIEAELYDKFEALIAAYPPHSLQENTHALVYDIFCFIDENAKLCAILFGENGDLSFLASLKYSMRRLYLETVTNITHSEDIKSIDYSYSYIASGFVGLIESWLSSDRRESPEEMATLAGNIITAGLHSFVE